MPVDGFDEGVARIREALAAGYDDSGTYCVVPADDPARDGGF